MMRDAPKYNLRWLVVINSTIFIMFGFLLQWPTILTLLMFPALVFMYVHLAHTREAEARLRFGDAYVRYAAHVPGWVPHLPSRGTQSGPA